METSSVWRVTLRQLESAAMRAMTPNSSIERTCPGKPGQAFHLKRYASQMRAILVLTFALITAPLVAFAQNEARPAAPSFKGVELYSWKDSVSGAWSFSLLPGTNRNKGLAEIKEPSRVISSVAQLEEHLVTLAEGEKVFWFLAGFKPGLSYPDQETISRILTFAAKHKITVLIE